MPRNESLTLMAVHAHPDDEASSTGGILARYADEGVQTVLVTCTNGELGDAPGGIKPGEAGHDEAEVVAVRKAELAASCEILGVSVAEQLGYHDSGMMGWPQNDLPQAFWQQDVDDAARRLVGLIELHRPQVVVTYDAFGFYGHPDHIQAHRITRRAVELTDVVDKLYYPTIPHSALPRFGEALREAGMDVPEDEEPSPEFGTPDEDVSAFLDCSAFVDAKFRALEAHQSQVADMFFLRLPRARFDSMFGIECFVRASDRTGAPIPEDDLFAGLR